MCVHSRVEFSCGYWVCVECGECFDGVGYGALCDEVVYGQSAPLVNEINILKFKIQIYVERFNFLFGCDVRYKVDDGGFNVPSRVVEDLFVLLYDRLGLRDFDTMYCECLVYGILLYIYKNKSIKHVRHELVGFERVSKGLVYDLNRILCDLNEMREMYNPLKHTLVMTAEIKDGLNRIFDKMNCVFKLRYWRGFWWATFYFLYFHDKYKEFCVLNKGVMNLSLLYVYFEEVEKKSEKFVGLLGDLKGLNV